MQPKKGEQLKLLPLSHRSSIMDPSDQNPRLTVTA